MRISVIYIPNIVFPHCLCVYPSDSGSYLIRNHLYDGKFNYSWTISDDASLGEKRRYIRVDLTHIVHHCPTIIKT